jgi:hypothetical protein
MSLGSPPRLESAFGGTPRTDPAPGRLSKQRKREISAPQRGTWPQTRIEETSHRCGHGPQVPDWFR